uniref:WGS project CAEQ00000000 data, annotated contig 719 n=1 Tax=Trypanosoma congolense (strain IL3000) TaxID=1068625 RepID=F9WI14_TRYCI|nr:unnamed protein product [Trypanosoma congolense IL3000]
MLSTVIIHDLLPSNCSFWLRGPVTDDTNYSYTDTHIYTHIYIYIPLFSGASGEDEMEATAPSREVSPPRAPLQSARGWPVNSPCTRKHYTMRETKGIDSAVQGFRPATSLKSPCSRSTTLVHNWRFINQRALDAKYLLSTQTKGFGGSVGTAATRLPAVASGQSAKEQENTEKEACAARRISRATSSALSHKTPTDIPLLPEQSGSPYSSGWEGRRGLLERALGDDDVEDPHYGFAHHAVTSEPLSRCGSRTRAEYVPGKEPVAKVESIPKPELVVKAESDANAESQKVEPATRLPPGVPLGRSGSMDSHSSSRTLVEMQQRDPASVGRRSLGTMSPVSPEGEKDTTQLCSTSDKTCTTTDVPTWINSSSDELPTVVNKKREETARGRRCLTMLDGAGFSDQVQRLRVTLLTSAHERMVDDLLKMHNYKPNEREVMYRHVGLFRELSLQSRYHEMHPLLNMRIAKLDLRPRQYQKKYSTTGSEPRRARGSRRKSHLSGRVTTWFPAPMGLSGIISIRETDPSR